jgi:hypothetical protein
MKKYIFIILSNLCLFFTVNAQWNGTDPIYTTSKVGIGTISPLGKLDILSGTDEVALRLSMPTSEDAAAYDIKWSNSNADVVHRIQYSSVYYDFMNINRATRNVSFNGGNVGIGTSPSGKLEILKNADLSGAITLANSGLVLRADNDGNDATLRFGVDNTNLKAIIQTQQTTTATKFDLLINPFGGNIGIGTTSPLGRVDILSGTDEVALRLSMPTSEDAAAYDIKWANSNADVVHRIQYASAYYDFMNVNRATRNVSFTGGNVGIGTTDTKGYKFAVAGKVVAEEVVVALQADWADFVFNKDYKLKDLEEVETFIEENNHLPDIPSENEVKENGVQVGEMNAKLLQKIEELTLYVIDINKRVKSLEEENKTLKEENSILKTQ